MDPPGWRPLDGSLIAAWALFIALTIIAYELTRSLVVGGIRRGIERRVDRFLHERAIPTDPFRHTHRLAVREMVLSEPGLVAAMAQRAEADRVPVAEVQGRVRAWLDEIVPQFNILAYYRVGYALGRTAAYATYHVRLDEASLKRAQAAIPEDSAVVYVSNHRSNADFVVTGFMLSRSVQVSYAVGEWARVWPLESLFKAFGSYFVRRGEKDPLYHRTLQAYVQLITKQGVTQAMFPEGGLSRDGALRPVKLGLLDTMARAKLDPRFDKPLVFVPVGINFDRVFEDENMVREARGEPPLHRRGAWQKTKRIATLVGKMVTTVPLDTMRFFAKRLKKHGVAAIHFGMPIVLDDWLREQAKRHQALPAWLTDDDRHARWSHLRPFGDALMEAIGRTVPATPVTLCCLAATRIGQARMERGVDRGDFVLALRDVAQELESTGAPFAVDDPYAARAAERAELGDHIRGREDLVDVALAMGDADRLRRVLQLALDVTSQRGILQEEGGRLRTRRWDLVGYYANSLSGHVPVSAADGGGPASGASGLGGLRLR